MDMKREELLMQFEDIAVAHAEDEYAVLASKICEMIKEARQYLHAGNVQGADIIIRQIEEHIKVIR